jgi:tRNA1(Val) A37 N6-methylase TrmN6
MSDAGKTREVVEDALLDGRLRLRQPAKGYRVAIDPVFLAAAVPARPNTYALDLGCGVGAAALCLLARVPEARVAGLEVQAELAALARVNAALNGLDDRFLVVEGDLAGPIDLPTGGFDEVLCNPPHQPAAASAPPNRAKALATHEGAADLDDWVRAALTFARANGGLTFVHRADRLDDLLAALRGKAGGVVVFPLWPREDQPAKRVLVRARKAVRAPTRQSQGLVLHDARGRYTAAAGAILRGGEGLAL